MQTTRAENPLINQIKIIFYNDLTNLALDQPDINSENIDIKIKAQIKMTLLNILSLQKANHEGIYLPNGTIISEKNCPNIYLGFLKALLNLKNAFQQLSPSEIELITSNINNNRIHLPLLEKIKELAENILHLSTFQEMIPQIEKFILEAKGIMNAAPEQIKFDETGVTPDLIRQTFYNEMVNQTIQAVNNGWITLDDLECQESYIFFALPALTLIEAINQSQNCEGIRLLGDKMLTSRNCPTQEHFAELFMPILTNKSLMKAKSPEELQVIKQLCLAKASEIAPELMIYKTPHVTNCVANINEIASQISRRGIFKLMIKKVIDVCLENLNQLQQSTRLRN